MNTFFGQAGSLSYVRTAGWKPAPRLGRLFEGGLVEFVVERFQADAEFFGGFGFVAAVAIEGVVDGLHFQVAERDGAGDADLRRRAAAAGKTLRQVIGADGRMIAEDCGVL